MKQFFAGLWQAIRKAPVARWIKPLWKGVLRSEVARECATLKAQLLAAVASQGPAAIDRVFDQSQSRLEAAVLKQKWLPGNLEDRLAALIEEWGNKAQAAARQAFAAGGIQALDLALTAAEDRLMAHIDAL